jgi:hypothetical protein
MALSISAALTENTLAIDLVLPVGREHPSDLVE